MLTLNIINRDYNFLYYLELSVFIILFLMNMLKAMAEEVVFREVIYI